MNDSAVELNSHSSLEWTILKEIICKNDHHGAEFLIFFLAIAAIFRIIWNKYAATFRRTEHHSIEEASRL